MAIEQPNSPFHRETEAALRGLADVSLTELEPAGLLMTLTVLGDALRLGVPVPSAVMRRAEALPEDAFRAAFGALVNEARTWSLPPELGHSEPSHSYDWTILQRDRAESVVVAARRILSPRGVLLDALDHARTFFALIDGLELTCGGTRGRDHAEDALGDRIVLATRGSWLDQLPDVSTKYETGDSTESLDVQAELSPPSDEAIDAYITSGEWRRWVETAAERSELLAEELQAMIEAGIECRSSVALTARRWLRDRKSTEAPVRLEIVPSLKLAAADAATELQATTTVELGVLYPLDVVAKLSLTATDVTLLLFTGPDVVLSAVELGSTSTTSPDHEGVWRLTAEIGSASILLRVESETGEVFSETLELAPAS